MHDGAVRDRSIGADFDQAARLGMNHHAVLNIGIGADNDGFHIAVLIHFVGTDYRIGADEHIFFDDDLAAKNCGIVDIG